MFMSYGARSTADLFMYSGFVPQAGANDDYDNLKVPVQLTNAKDKLMPHRVKLLQQLTLQPSMTLPLYANLNHDGNASIIALLKVQYASAEDLKTWLQDPYQLTMELTPRVLKWLQMRMQI